MDILYKIYIACGALIVIGVAWVVYRFIVYQRKERERASNTDLLFTEEQFKAYLEELKKDNPDYNKPASEEPPVSSGEPVESPPASDNPDCNEPASEEPPISSGEPVESPPASDNPDCNEPASEEPPVSSGEPVASPPASDDRDEEKTES